MNHKLTNTAYKLLSQNMQSYGGTGWEIGVPVVVTVPGNTLCTNQLLHCYSDLELAVIFNPIHANIRNPRLFEIKTSEILADDGLKQGCKEQVLVEELPVPVISTDIKIAFAILCALEVWQDETFVNWAYKWLNKEDRSKTAAYAAYAAAYATDAAYAYAYATAAYATATYATAAAAYAAATAAANTIKINKSINFLTLLQKAKQYE